MYDAAADLEQAQRLIDQGALAEARDFLLDRFPAQHQHEAWALLAKAAQQLDQGEALGYWRAAYNAAVGQGPLIFQDGLTGLPNRTKLGVLLQEAALLAQPFALALFDFERFQHVNAALGYAKGDRILAEAAQRLRRALLPGEWAASIGGGEFAVMLPAGAVEQRVLHLRRILSEEFRVDGDDIALDANVGVALYPRHAKSGEDLLRLSSAALKEAKQGGGFCLYTAGQGGSPVGLEAALRRALSRHEFALYHQPLIATATSAVCGTEALLRWKSPQFGSRHLRNSCRCWSVTGRW